MWFFSKNETVANPNEVMEGLKKSQEMLNERFANKQISNEMYLQKAEELRKKIEKCQKQIDRL